MLLLKRIETLTEGNPEDPESHLVLGEAALAARLWGEARRHLAAAGAEPPEHPTSGRAARLMAEVVEREHGDGAEARRWLERAAAASPLDPTYVCSTCGGE